MQEKVPYRARFNWRTEAEKKQWIEVVDRLRIIGAEQAMQLLTGNEVLENSYIQTGESLAKDTEEFLRPLLENLCKRLSINLSSFRVACWKQKEQGEFLHSVRTGFNLDQQNTLERFAERLESGMAKYRPAKIIQSIDSKSGNKVGIMNLSDLHLDKMTCYEETEQDSNIWKNVGQASKVVDELLQHFKNEGCNKIIIMVGNDLNNVNDLRNTTVKGTNQATYIHHVDAFEITLNFWIQQIDKALEIADVEVVGIPGNHARDMENMIVKSLKPVYRLQKNIQFWSSRLERKVITFGKNMFIFEHGHHFNKKDYSGALAAHYSSIWNEHPNRYLFLGHFHQEKVFDLPGIQVHIARAMCEDDEFHFANGYLGIEKTAYAHTFSECGRYFQTMRVVC